MLRSKKGRTFFYQATTKKFFSELNVWIELIKIVFFIGGSINFFKYSIREDSS